MSIFITTARRLRKPLLLTAIVALTATPLFAATLLPIEVGGKYGAVDRQGRLIIEPRFEAMSGSERDFLFVRANGKAGVVDTTGQFVVEPKYDALYSCNRGYLVQVAGKWGSLDEKGAVLIEPQFDLLGCGGDRSPAKVGDKWGIVDRSGKFVIPPQWDGSSVGSEERIAVNRSGKWGYTDFQGRIVIKPQFDYASPFFDGLADIAVNGKWGVINGKGRVVVKPVYDSRVAFGKSPLGSVQLNGKVGFIDKQGVLVIQPKFDRALGFDSNGMAQVELDKRAGFVDAHGNTVVELKFESVGSFGESDMAPAKIDGKWGYIDRKGAFVFPPQYDGATHFVNGIASVKIGDRWGAIDHAGRLVIPPRYDGAFYFSEGVAQATLASGSEYIDTQGRRLVSSSRGDGTSVLVDPEGKVLWPTSLQPKGKELLERAEWFDAIAGLDADAMADLFAKGVRPPDIDAALIRVVEVERYAADDVDARKRFAQRKIAATKALVAQGARLEVLARDNGRVFRRLFPSQSSVAMALLDLGFPADIKCGQEDRNRGGSLVSDALHFKDTALVHALLEHGADPNLACGGETPLAQVLSYEPFKGGEKCLVSGTPIFAGAASLPFGTERPDAKETRVESTNNKKCVYVEPEIYDRKSFVELLLQHGANPNLKSEGASLWTRVQHDDMETPALLAKYGATTDDFVFTYHSRWDSHDIGLLAWAVMEQSDGVAAFLLQEKPKKRRRRDGYAIYFAVEQNRPEMVRKLLEHGADASFLFSDGEEYMTVLHLAVKLKEIEVAKELIRGGADINAATTLDASALWHTDPGGLPDEGGLTPLMFSVRAGDFAMTKLLLDNGADISRTTSKGRRASGMAYKQTYELLRQYELKPR